MDLKRARSDDDNCLSHQKLIMSIEKMSKEDVEAVYEAARRRVNEFRTEKQQSLLRAFQKGDKVYFSDKAGKMVWGTVKSVNTKTVSVHECSDGQKWRVAPGFLQLDRVAQNFDLFQ